MVTSAPGQQLVAPCEIFSLWEERSQERCWYGFSAEHYDPGVSVLAVFTVRRGRSLVSSRKLSLKGAGLRARILSGPLTSQSNPQHPYPLRS